MQNIDVIVFCAVPAADLDDDSDDTIEYTQTGLLTHSQCANNLR